MAPQPLINQVDAKIRELTQESRKARPFLCQGSPLGRHVFLVGINPGTNTPFWKYWNKDDGCNKEAWLNDYKKRHRRLGPTRKRIEILCHALEGDYLETNIYHIASKRLADLKREFRSTALFEFLLDNLRPSIVFVHGKPAVTKLEELLKVSLRLGEFSRVERNGLAFDVYPERHLSYHWKDEDVAKLGSRLRARVKNVYGR